MPISPLEGRRSREDVKGRGAGRERSPWVLWIALSLGVFFTGTGVILLLWGLSWQSWTIAPKAIGEEGLVGGPILLPLGVFCLVLGIMWLFQGWTGFRRPEDRNATKVCPNCHRRIEEDLDFCYHCMKRLDGQDKGGHPPGRTDRSTDKEENRLELEGLGAGLRGQRK